MGQERAIVFIAWGNSYIQEIERCMKESEFPAYDRIMITDVTSTVPDSWSRVIRADFQRQGLFRKTELINWLPHGYESYLLLDSDIRILADIDLGFSKAEQFGMAMAPASHYSLDHFWGFDEVMRKEGLALQGQLQYNSGVIFFTLREDVKEVLELWAEYGRKYDGTPYSDQPFLTLAVEKLGFNPYTLSLGYNYRGFGDNISGIVRIWHSRYALPEGINHFESAWPPRRVLQETIITPEMDQRLAESRTSARSGLKRFFFR